MEKVKKFTDAMVRNIKSSQKRTDYTEGGGFCLRVSPSGKKSWVYSYKFDGKSKRYTVGYYPSLSVAKARKLIADAGLLKDRGIDPAQAKKDTEEALKRELEKEKLTIEWLANDFYTRYIMKNRKVPKQIKQQIDADIIPSLGKIKLDGVTTRQITIALEKIVDRGSFVHANKVLSTIKQMFTYALSKGIVEKSPVQGINSINIGGKEKPRDRNLSLREIKLVWQWLDVKDNHHLHPATPLALKLLLLTGIRSHSLRLAEWKEFDFDNSLWTIPPYHLKIRKTDIQKPHKVHLTDFTKKILIELKEISGEKCNMVLPSIKDESKPLTDKMLPRAVKRLEGRIKEVEPWTPHDLRRTFSTQLSAMGIAPHVVEKCLGHKLPGIMAVYNQHEYLDERKQALEQWSDKIEMLVTNSNVVALNTHPT